MHPVTQFVFPSEQKVSLLTVALPANGTSAQRDAESLGRLARTKWGAHVQVLTDQGGKQGFLETLRQFGRGGGSLLFTMSAHGYGTRAPEARRAAEPDGQSEYVLVQGQRVYDFEILEALFDGIPQEQTQVLCLVDTCHSGTMLDFPGFTADGGRTFHGALRSGGPPAACVSACSDSELAGEDISAFGGWGGKLTAAFLDFVHPLQQPVHVLTFYQQVFQQFSQQKYQRSHPVLGYSLSSSCG
jgi:hypothetical protein